MSPTWDTYTYIHTCKTYAHTHTHITEHYASVAVLADCDHLPVQNAAPFFYFIVCACAFVRAFLATACGCAV